MGQFASPYVYAGNSPLVYVDPDGELAWFVPVLIGAAIGGTTGAIVAENNGQDWWKGAIVGGVLGAAGGSFVGSAVGASGLGTAAAGITQTAVNNAAFNIALSETFGGGAAWKAGLTGLGSGVFGATGGFGLVNKGFFGRLGYQALATSFRSVGRNWTAGRGLLSKVTVGAGPVNLTFGKDQRLLQFWENAGNAITNGLGIANFLLGNGRIFFDKDNLAIGYSGGFLGKSLYGDPYDTKGNPVFGAWTGAYTIGGNIEPELGYRVHELTHIWQNV